MHEDVAGEFDEDKAANSIMAACATKGG